MTRRRWSKERVVAVILGLHRSGEKLNSDYVQKHRCPLYQAACYYWGGWKQAIEGAGLSYDMVRVLTPLRKRVWSKDIIIRTIRERHQNGEPLNSNHIQTQEQRLYGAAHEYFGGWQQAVEAAGFDYTSVRKQEQRSWSKTSIVEEVIRRKKEKLPINGDAVAKQDRGLYQAARRHFGIRGWSIARTLAGFDPIDPRPWQIWDEETVCKEIKRLHADGVLLNTGSVSSGSYSYIHSAGKKVFGTWSKTIRSSGLDYQKIRKGRMPGWWTKNRVVLGIKNLAERGIRLSSKSIRLSHTALFRAAVTQFGCWSEAVEAAGISYRQHCRIWSTKAWMRRMSTQEHERITKSIPTLTLRRRRK